MRETLHLFSPALCRAAIFITLFAVAATTRAQTATPSAPPAAPAISSTSAAPSTNGSVSGIVVGKNGELYAGVHVVLQETGPGAPPPLVQETDANGQFHFAEVPAGAFRLTLTSSGFVTQTVSGTVQPGQDYNAHSIVMPVAETSSDVHVTASLADIAEAQLKIEETQRVLGFMPNFYVTYDHKAAPLTTRQKYQLAWRTSIDPFTWGATALFAGIEQADNAFPGYGQGTQGYAKRFGAGYADAFIGTMLGGAMFPSLFKQDPRYFYKGTGSVNSRLWYAIANTVICKGDNGHWQPSYSSILGGMAAGGIANAYYPDSDRGNMRVTFEAAGFGLATSAVQNVMQEFLVRKFTPHFRHNNPSQP